MQHRTTIHMHLLNDTVYEVVDIQPMPHLIGRAYRIQLRQPHTNHSLSFVFSCSPLFPGKLQRDGAFKAPTGEEALIEYALSVLENSWDGEDKTELQINDNGDYQLGHAE